MQRRTSSGLLTTASIAGGIGFVVFAALLIVVGVTFSPAIFLVLMVAVAVGAFLLLRSDPGAASPEGQVDDAPAEPGTPGVPVTEAAPVTLGAERTDDERPEIDRTAVVPVGAATPEGATASDAPVESGDDDAGDVAGSAPSAVTRKLSETDGTSDTDDEDSASDAPSTTEIAGDEDGAGIRPATDEIVEAVEPPEDNVTTIDEAEDASDGVIGHPPARLDAPREGGADDLKRIRGVGPKLEEALNGIGIYHLDQIAGWSAPELAWVDEHLEGFKGRASRDAWVEQARELSQSDE